MTLLAVTGVEDTLQDQVGTCIEDFRKADIRVWMLTGDMRATAEQIALQCKLITKTGPTYALNILEQDCEEEINIKISEFCKNHEKNFAVLIHGS